MLADKPLTYSEILETLNIDSGHLSYHLESLGDLTVHANNGQYQLSSFGVAAVKLMGGVEEQSPVSSYRRFKLRRLFVKVYPVILVLALIGASFHLVTYATVVSTNTCSTQTMLYPFYTNIPLNVGAGETFVFNVTIEHRPSIYGQGFGVRSDVQECTFYIPQLEGTLTGWDEATIWLDSIFNLTTLMSSSTQEVTLIFENGTSRINQTVIWNGISQTNETVVVTVQGGGFGVNPNDATDPSNLEVEVYLPEGTALTKNFYRSEENRFDTSSSTPVTITQPTTCTFKITNNGSWDWNGALVANLQFQSFEKPYFYWGIFGLAIALGYFGVVTAAAYKTRHPVEKR